MNVPANIAELVKSLYKCNSMLVKAGGEESSTFGAKKEVDIILSLLSNVYGEYIMRQTLEDWSTKVSAGSSRISNLRYTDDNNLVAVDEEEYAALINQVKAVSKDLGLRINASKTNVMVID